MSGDRTGEVNPHYLDHLVAAGQAQAVEAAEDIVAGNGAKLLARGARIDAGTRERLLQHKLRKPLEDCVQLADAVPGARLQQLAAELIERHSLLRALAADGRARDLPASLGALALPAPLRSLLGVYADSQPRLAHAVGVALLAMALARRLLPGDVGRHRTLAAAGLLHDVGELYIDPAILQRDRPLSPEQWRHVASHPLVGARVLREMAGAGREVADAVLLHHERLDGFGYPAGAAGERFTLDGQILAVAEWLAALLESGRTPLARAAMAPRLVPGEFSPPLLHAVAAAARASDEAAAEAAAAELSLDGLERRVERIAATLDRFRVALPWLDARIAEARPALRALLQAGRQRMLRVQASFSSSGFDAQPPALLLAELRALDDAQVNVEVATLLAELRWRLREVERESRLRAAALDAADRAVLDELLRRVAPPVVAQP